MRFKKLLFAGLVIGVVSLGGKTASASSVDPNSIVDYLDSLGEDSSFTNRANIAKNNGIGEYRGTADQNTYLLSKLKGNSTSNYKKANKNNVESTNSVETTSNSSSNTGKTITVSATAYTAYCEGCSGVTYTGQDLRVNPSQKVIAVDPTVIPLGSKVYVEGYGEAIAGDIGGAIKGSKIDVFIANKQEALKWGRKNVKITIYK